MTKLMDKKFLGNKDQDLDTGILLILGDVEVAMVLDTWLQERVAELVGGVAGEPSSTCVLVNKISETEPVILTRYQ